jgi:glycosyltransferase involved in cell wall biosynthesis
LKISAVIPAYNEEETIAEIVEGTLKHVDEVIVVDDGSTDETASNAERAGAKVLRQPRNKGVLEATRIGLETASGDIVVTIDADGQHDPDEIPRLVRPILEDSADLAIGSRPSLPHLSEKILTAITNLKVPCSDASTGFRAIRKNISDRMNIHGSCLCGTFILEAARRGARIENIPISVRPRLDMNRRIKTRHLRQTLWVLNDLIRL